jgi:hypothetical protein
MIKDHIHKKAVYKREEQEHIIHKQEEQRIISYIQEEHGIKFKEITSSSRKTITMCLIGPFSVCRA